MGQTQIEEVVNADSLIDLHTLDDSSELWLIQLPQHYSPDFHGQEMSLELNQDGQLATFEGLAGNKYSMVSYPSQDSDMTVFLSSPSGPRIAGKVSRHVSLVRYPEPDELKQPNTDQQEGAPNTTLLSNTPRSIRNHIHEVESGRPILAQEFHLT